MRSVELTGGIFEYDELFIPVVVQAIINGKTGALYNPYDSCFIFMESIVAVEVTEGVMTPKAEII